MTPEEIKNYIDQPIYHQIAEAALEFGAPVFIVGGFVRDLLLDRPSKDLDIVVEGSGIDFAQALSNRLKGTRVTYYKRFGTAMFHHNEMEYEVVGARKESYRSDSRKPIVEDGTLMQDRERRDFTMNALSISLNKEDFGEVIDPFNGIQDLRDGRIKTPLPPAQTYSDDPLRMMRAIRFAAQLDFTIEKKSYDAISDRA
ncbi:MAG: tRNA nucleotidyltransferase, partial [Salibacteraceae bacterium]